MVELVKYKKNWNQGEVNRTKTKRVPTVKKELSTQKEILIGSGNETQVSSKSVPRSEEAVNRLNEELEPIRRRNVVEVSEYEEYEYDKDPSSNNTRINVSDKHDHELFVLKRRFSFDRVSNKLLLPCS